MAEVLGALGIFTIGFAVATACGIYFNGDNNKPKH